ncbi:hypothetical protein [Synechococcus sp. MU1642]|uniref:hypothetical protein n=1 Tax=Synechococcus sp. MU1642 TaxID=2508348 RepID=UPI001CF84A23|nr:hypothetical protein [Synechococcus sp. MU1642]
MTDGKGKKIKSFVKSFYERLLPHLKRSKDKVVPYVEKAKIKASPYFDKAKPYVDKAIPYIDKAKDKVKPFAKNTLIPFVKKRPIVSSIAVLMAIGALSSLFGNDQPGVVEIDSASKGLAGSYEAQERLRLKNRLSCLKIVENPTHIVTSGWGSRYYNVSGNSVTPLTPKWFSRDYGLCEASFSLKKDIVSSSDGDIDTERWEIRNGDLVKYSSTKYMSSGWEKGNIKKTVYPKATQLQIEQYLESYTEKIEQEKSKLN